MARNRRRAYFSSRNERGGTRTVLKRVFFAVLLLFLGHEFLETFVVSSVRAGSASMEPTVETGDRFLIFPLAYGADLPLLRANMRGFGQPQRGDIALIRPSYRAPEGLLTRLLSPLIEFFTLRNRDGAGEGNWQSSLLIKRIIGLPGDTVRFRDNVAFIRPQDGSDFVSEFIRIDRSYEVSAEPLPPDWLGRFPLSGDLSEISLGPGEYFVVGDSRTRSLDSRHFGAVSADAIIGRIDFRYWPLSRIGAPR